jgi:hypothetical protein
VPLGGRTCPVHKPATTEAPPHPTKEQRAWPITSGRWRKSPASWISLPTMLDWLLVLVIFGVIVGAIYFIAKSVVKALRHDRDSN